jgi:hypothetical protein
MEGSAAIGKEGPQQKLTSTARIKCGSVVIPPVLHMLLTNVVGYKARALISLTLSTHTYSFKLFWDTHPAQDGAVLQYSINNGTTWINVGSYNDPIDCLNENWFNSPDIVNLNTLSSVKEGWSGTSRPNNGSCLVGNGIGGWVTAKHGMPYLAGLSNVRFRFCFGSGPGCNNFDGFAFDNMYIG